MLPCKQLLISSTQHSSSREASRINTPRSTLEKKKGNMGSLQEKKEGVKKKRRKKEIGEENQHTRYKSLLLSGH